MGQVFGQGIVRIIWGAGGETQRLGLTWCLGAGIIQRCVHVQVWHMGWADSNTNTADQSASPCRLTSLYHGSLRGVECPTWNSGNMSDPANKTEDARPLMTLPGKSQCPFHCTLLGEAVTTLPKFKSRRIRLDGERQGHIEIVTWHRYYSLI